MTDPRTIPLRWLLALCLLPNIVSCSDPIEPRHTDIEIAHATWVSASHSDYSFEIATESSWFPKSGYTRVRVRSGQAVAAINPDGEPVALTL